MLRSLLIKLAMLGTAIALVLWMGWPAEDERDEEPVAPTQAPVPVLQAQAPPAETRDQGASRREARKEPAGPPSRLDLNRATSQELEGLPGVGPVLAQRIVQWRRAHGNFRKVEDLNAVKGIGEKKLGQLRPLVTVGPSSPSSTMPTRPASPSPASPGGR